MLSILAKKQLAKSEISADRLVSQFSSLATFAEESNAGNAKIALEWGDPKNEENTFNIRLTLEVFHPDI